MQNPVHRVLGAAGLPSYLLNEVPEISATFFNDQDLAESVFDGRAAERSVIGGTYLLEIVSAEERPSIGIITRRRWVGMVLVTRGANLDEVARRLDALLRKHPTDAKDVVGNFGPQWASP